MMNWSDVTVQGVDLSYTATGLLTWRPDGVYHETIHTSSTWSDRRRRRHVARRILETLRRDVHKGPALIMKEAPIVGKTFTGVRLGMLHGVVEEYLWRPGVVIVEVATTALKAYAATGNASKETMLAAARERLTHVFGFPMDHNQADAMWLAAIGLAHIGQLPITESPKMRATRFRIDWPETELAMVN